MSVSILSVDPVGEPKNDSTVSSFIDGLKKKWDEFRAGLGKATKVTLVHVTKFLLFSLDGLIVFVDGLMVGGPDKKATVMTAVSALYDYIIKGNLPLWLLPFSTTVKAFIVGTVISIAIDWIVAKYKEGAWKK